MATARDCNADMTTNRGATPRVHHGTDPMNVHASTAYDPIVDDEESLIPIDNMERWRIRCYAVLAIADIATICLSFLFANRVVLGDWLASHGLTMLSVLLPIYLWMAAINGAYNGKVLLDSRVGAFKAIRAIAFAGAALLIIAYSFKVGAAFSRLVFWIGALSAVALLMTIRLVLGRAFVRIQSAPFSTVVLVDGIDWQAQPNSVVIHVDRIGFDPQTDDPVHYHQFAKLIAHADRVLIACRDDRIVAWAHVLKSMAVDGEILAPDVDRIGMIGVSHYRDRRTLVVSAGPLHLRDRIVKRIFDISVSAIALAVLAVPLIAIAVAIRLESAGPVLFRQQRIGRDNKLFMMLKFRSMYHDKCDPSASVLTARSDSRVTRIGQFIRRNSIDELPQLINVLRGDMSMVGPRPHALSARAADRLYWEIDARYRHRHAVKPGVTGLAQVRGFRGATVETTDLTNRLSSDLEYLRDWSMSKDIWILFRTAFVIRHDNAF